MPHTTELPDRFAFQTTDEPHTTIITGAQSIVSPNFPAHGSDTYDVHKGSVVLFFQNGFTQAIACIIDAAPNGTPEPSC